MRVWSKTGWVDEVAVRRLPEWLAPLAETLAGTRIDELSRFLPPDGVGRHSAVLVLFGDGPLGPDLLLIRRAVTMRSHAGQPAFPGGAVDDGDEDATAAALREAWEETGLDPSGVVVFGALPDLWVPASGFAVTPVLGWWAESSPVAAQDPAEVASVHRVPLADLASPDNRVRVRHPTGFVGPAFLVEGLTVWGFTGGIINGLLDRAGWALPWDTDRVIDLPNFTPDP